MQNRRHSSFSGRRQPRHGDNSDFSLGEILSEKDLFIVPFIVPEQWKEFMKQAETEQASSASVKFKELRSWNTSEHNMGSASSSKNFEAGTQASTTWAQPVIL
jgi:hypothetical protein